MRPFVPSSAFVNPLPWTPSRKSCILLSVAWVEKQTLTEPISWLDGLANSTNMPFIENDTDSGPDIHSKYITALYFTFTGITSIGFGNVAANTNAEKVFAICTMVLGGKLPKNVIMSYFIPVAKRKLKSMLFTFFSNSFNECVHIWKRVIHNAEAVQGHRGIPREASQY